MLPGVVMACQRETSIVAATIHRRRHRGHLSMLCVHREAKEKDGGTLHPSDVYYQALMHFISIPQLLLNVNTSQIVDIENI